MRRYNAFGWIVWKIMTRVLRRKVARQRTRLTAIGVVLAVLAVGLAAARQASGSGD